MSAPSAWRLYHRAKLHEGDGVFDLDSHTLKCALYTSASNLQDLSLETLAELTGELANGSGYTTGGVALTSVQWSLDPAGRAVLRAANPSWTASGASLTARYAVIYDDTPTSPADPLLCYALLDAAPGDIVVQAGQQFILDLSAGIYSKS